MKPIQMKSNLRVADQVRKAINRLNTSSALMKRASFECFDNCREQGYVLKVWRINPITCSPFNIAFSENRNSDDIVVYCYNETQYPGNLIKESAGWNRSYFQFGQVDAAARFILEQADKFLHPQAS
jgi:hypothetical protein